MGYNYQENNANIKKSVTPGNFIEFPIEWRKPHCSKFICLEMTNKTKLPIQVENGEKQLRASIALVNRAVTTTH